MKKNNWQLEKALHDLYHDTSNLPLLWQVIYHEAMRANHLPFSPQDIQDFQTRSIDVSEDKAISSEELAQSAVQVFSCTDLSSMRQMIATKPFALRRQIYALYLRLIHQLRQHIVSTLH